MQNRCRAVVKTIVGDYTGDGRAVVEPFVEPFKEPFVKPFKELCVEPLQSRCRAVAEPFMETMQLFVETMQSRS